jgi:hypothetical protein
LQRLLPQVATARDFNRVVEVDDDVLLSPTQVPQGGPQLAHVGERLYALREQHLQGVAGSLQRQVAHCTNHDQQDE